MGHKLGILPRQYDKTGWHRSKQFGVGEIQTIKVDEAGKNKSLNSIPSPFARMHLFETAFEMVQHDLINKTNLAGETYNRLVSDCLDVFELLYNWDTHLKDGKPLELDTWKREEEIRNLNNSRNNKHRLLGETLGTFLQAEGAFLDFDKCLIIKYNKKVIAGSSPFTGFFTSPDNLTDFELLKPLSQIAYFSRSISFEHRKMEVKRYIYDLFEKNDTVRNNIYTTAFRRYLEWYKDNGHINEEANTTLQPLLQGNAQVRIFNVPLHTAKSIGAEFFEPYIVRLNYRLDTERYYSPHISNDQRTYDYLLPLTASFYESFDPAQIREIVSITEEDADTVEVTIRVDNGNTSKKYQKKKIHEQDGKIVDLYNDHQINFNLGIFPFIKVIEQAEEINFNDSYRVMMILQDYYNKYNNKDFNLNFGKDKAIFTAGELYKLNRTDRSVMENKIGGSTFYSLNTCFDYIQVEMPALEGNKPIKCTIAPKWQEKKIGSKQIDFSIDFGTTSTFIAYTDDPLHKSPPRPFELNEKEMFVAFLNRRKEKRPDLRWIDCYERALPPEFLYSAARQIEEFVPSIIKKDEKYEFPIRSVLYQQRSLPAPRKEALSNANISFIYQKKEMATLPLDNQQFIPNLKWNIKTNEDFSSAVEVFIEELFLLIRVKTLLNDGDPRKSKIIWFAPLSFTSIAKKAYTDLWGEYARKYLKSSDSNIHNLTESEAPFHYLFKNSTINNPKNVLTIDIGGGSTDIMAFNEKKPVIGTSIHFGANVIWGNGFIEFNSAKSNGIFLAIKQGVSEKFNSTELKKLNEDYCTNDNLGVGSEEIINFWIANDATTGVINRLNNGDFRLSYLLHLSALTYHSLKLIQVNGQKPPTCIIFSGNGSKYVDLIHDHRYISKIWGYFMRKIFSTDCVDPQVILPEQNRKEATCFGGLYVNSSDQEFRTENYMGFERKGEKFEKYRDIENDKENVFQKLLIAFHEFIDLFFGMNDTSELNFRNHFGIEVRLGKIKKFLLEKAAENLDEGYIKRSQMVGKEDLITDSLFFYPLVGLIYKMNRLTPADLQDASDRTTFFAGAPDSEMTFLLSRMTPVRRPDSIYTITFEDENTEAGEVSIIDDPAVHNMALGVYQGALDPVCTYTDYPQAGQLIKVKSPGKARKEADKWILEEKIQIEFN